MSNTLLFVVAVIAILIATFALLNAKFAWLKSGGS